MMTALGRWGEINASGTQVQDNEKGRPFSAASARRASISMVVFGLSLARRARSGRVMSQYDTRPAAASTGTRSRRRSPRRRPMN